MFVHLPIVIMAMLSPVTVSDTVPKFDIVSECRFEGGSIVELDRCSENEGAALRELQRAWAQFARADKRNCIASAAIGGFASYVELLTCLEMARDAKNGDSNPSAPQTTEANATTRRRSNHWGRTRSGLAEANARPTQSLDCDMKLHRH